MDSHHSFLLLISTLVLSTGGAGSVPVGVPYFLELTHRLGAKWVGVYERIIPLRMTGILACL